MRYLACVILVLCIVFSASAAETAKFTLTSPDIKHGAFMQNEQVFNGFGCSGRNLSPVLVWKNPPAGTKSFALTVYDPDAPTGSGWWHWVVYNIPATIASLPKGAGTPDGKLLPPGSLQVNTDFGGPGYGGPCPPVGHKAHRYIFTIYALNVEKIDLPPNATAAMAGFFIRQNTIAKASMTGYYGRKK
jgi:Raf kinase inhibitor-like YbhB/YbcL family protein